MAADRGARRGAARDGGGAARRGGSTRDRSWRDRCLARIRARSAARPGRGAREPGRVAGAREGAVKRPSIGTVFWIAAAASPVHAAEEAGGLLFPWINFGLLIATLVVLLRKPIQTYFGDRRAAIRKDLDDAAAMKRRAEEHYAQWNRRLVDLERELDEIRAGAQERAEADRPSRLA